MYNYDDYELHVLQHGSCPFCRFKTEEWDATYHYLEVMGYLISLACLIKFLPLIFGLALNECILGNNLVCSEWYWRSIKSM